MKLRYWSDVAQREFAALFEDRDYSRPFVDAVADAIIRGWPPNRDKPLWALALLVAALAATRPEGRPDPAASLDVLTLSPTEILHRLLTAEGPREGALAIHPGGTKVRLVAYEASLVAGRTRIAILKKLVEFLIAADGFAHAAEVMAILDTLADPATFDEPAFRGAVRALSRRLYDYRKAHIAEGHATSGFEYVKRKLGHIREPADDDLLDLWRAEDNQHFVTYRMALQTAFAFLSMRREMEERGHLAASASVDEPGVERILAAPVDGEDDAEDGPAGAVSALGFAPVLADASEETPFAGLKSSALKTYTQAEFDFCDLVVSAWPHGERYTLSLLRLLAFHPIQSGLSNSLRTGRSKVPLETRVTCVEAMTYRDIDARVATLAEKTAGWLAVGVSLATPDSQSERVAAIRAQGVAILSRTRSKSFDVPREALAARFAAMSEDLVALARLLGAVRGAIAKVERPPDPHPLDPTFADDRNVFAAEFARRYLAGERAHG
ncbi:hypothetical protein [Acuticoccus mangrovi]|uniref:Uncharacterized protein n=1 Tax=Acuticoccus mangrovi TaxID=2796142 RepID=A0A934MG14_9HYPH|nr:hypothetical protein [Acuticoccus mangrovi]MBJ3776068.1 hypothetical protein [Acuticoccus mangrovi]